MAGAPKKPDVPAKKSAKPKDPGEDEFWKILDT
jgi:hypothetical protein